MLEKIRKDVENIIICGLLRAVLGIRLVYKNPFTECTLDRVVINVLRKYIVTRLNKDVKYQIFSTSSRLPRCTKVIYPGETLYSCVACQKNESFFLCYDCLLKLIGTPESGVVAIVETKALGRVATLA
ncbi:hypothetical protein RF11_12572 [Thelohanellus kitauei]|uniref:Uncharacterized protein n=1 Tax=Thelohanellus kitauei TaxID=669202 RepID=A0A0C2JA97_THEKT|nr:hypothetical protein RF11_12572 [Thelohanellus kitauei]